MILTTVLNRFRLTFAAALAMAVLASGAIAQTAPQLLPYTMKLVAGGGTNTYTAGTTCPSGNVSTDAYGDGCLATEIKLTAGGTKTYYGQFTGFAIADKTGAVFFSDGYDGLVRRIDPTTGIVTAVAGGATSSPASGATCGSFKSADTLGDGCLGTAVKLDNPSALAFDAAGNLYFGDVGYGNIREIAATAGVVPASGGVISLVAGYTTYGYKVNNTGGGNVIAATQSYLDEPFGLAFDTAGNLYVSDEGENAIEVINLTGANETLQGVSIPAGTIEKIMGYYGGTTGDCPSYTSTSSRGGCKYGTYTEGAAAISAQTDSPYQLAVVPSTNGAPNAGYVYFSNEFTDDVSQISSGNVVTTYAGTYGNGGKTITRGPAGTTGIGSTYGVAADGYGNLYITDASSGVIWRVDQSSKSMYVVAGGASTVCTGATDANGDGCPGTQAKFGGVGTGSYTTTSTVTNLFGVSVDANANLFVGDASTSTVREVASGTQFGVIGANQPTQTLDIHFGIADAALSSGAYTLTAGANNFSLGTATCSTNSDNTTDCLLPVTATPSVLGPFSATLQVKSVLGGVNNFTLSGVYVQSPTTRTTLSYAVPSVSCTGTTTYSTSTPVTLTSTLVANGPSAPTGTITFKANGTQIGTPQTVTNIGTSANPVYGATLSYTFSTVGTYTLTATYSGDGYFKTSTGQLANTITASTASFSATPVAYSQSTVNAGQTALYSFTIAQSVYSGTITFACSGLPANSSCSFSPATITASGCSVTNTVALSVLTQQGPVAAGSLGFAGRWTLLFAPLTGLLALGIGLRRRKSPLLMRTLLVAVGLLMASSGLMACGNGTTGGPATPSGGYSVVVTATGSDGTTSTLKFPLKVN